MPPFTFGPAVTRGEFLAGALGAAAFALTPTAFAAENRAAMTTRPIPKSSKKEMLPVIGLGTRSMSRTDTKAVAGQADVIRTLLNGGGTLIDTAANYSGGDSEEVIGEALAKDNARAKAFLATKLSERGKDAGLRSIENSFKSLRTDVIDLFFVHNMVDIETQLPTLLDYKAKGKIRYVGITFTGNGQDGLIDHLDKLDFIEFQYAADSREAESRLLPAARDKGVATLIALPLGRGRLLQAVKGKEVPQWAKEELGVETFAQLLLKFVIGHPAVTVAIPSTLNPSHMAENVAAGKGPIPNEKQRGLIADIWRNA